MRNASLAGIVFSLLSNFVFAQGPTVYWTDPDAGKIQRFDPQVGVVEDVLRATLNQPKLIAIDSLHGKLYWTDSELRTIRRANLDGTNIEDIVPFGAFFYAGFVLDPEGDRIYWTSSSSTIRRSHLDGSGAEVFINTFGDIANGAMALDLAAGKIYWGTYNGNPGKIWIADLSAPNTNVQPLLTGIGTPVSIALDLEHQKLYWIDKPGFQNRSIRRIGLNGQNLETVLTSDVLGNGVLDPEILALDFDQGKMIWVEPQGDAIRQANLDGSEIEEIVPETPLPNSEWRWGIALDGPNQKLYWTNPGSKKIERANRDGSQVTTVLDTPIVGPGPICIDRIARKIYWGDNVVYKIQRANLDGSEIEDIASGFRARSLAIHKPSNKLYWTRVQGFNQETEGLIQRANLDGSGVVTLYTTGDGFDFRVPTSIAINPITQRLYWIEEDGQFSNEQIYWSDLNGAGATWIHSTIYLDYLAVHPSAGFLFWSGYDSPSARIKRADLDGSPVTTIANVPTLHPSLAIDEVANTIYWNESPNTGNSAIRKANLDGSQAQTVISGAFKPEMIALFSPERITSSVPAHNSIDARQPSDIKGKEYFGFQSVDLSFDMAPIGLAANDFSTQEQGGDGIAPALQSFVFLDTQTVQMNFSNSIEPGAWTTITHIPSGSSVRLGYLPGDVNGDRTSSPVDILALIDSLNGVTPRPIYSTDMNRSGVAEPSDILRLIDLLNGAGAYEIWNGVSLP